MKHYAPSPVEVERRSRIKLSVAAYAYEMLSVSIMTDNQFDALALTIRPRLVTGHKVMDKFFKEQFAPDTGMWIHKHPQLDGIKRIYEKVYACEATKVQASSRSKRRAK